MISKVKFKAIVFLSITMFAFEAKPQVSEVIPVDWGLFPNSPDDENAERWLAILHLVSKNILMDTWDSLVRDDRLNTYFELGQTYDAKSIRPLAQYAYTLSVIIALNQYDPSVANQSQTIATQKTITIIKSVAKAHVVNGGTYNKEWGSSWQSGHWASTTAIAAWLLWEKLSTIDRIYITNMVEFEANRFINAIPVFANENLYLDTRAEDNGWNAWVLETAAAMMPNHPNYMMWRNKSIEFRMTAVARLSDLNDEAIIDGLPAFLWMRGYNVSVDYAVGNHKAYPHPDYSATTIFQPLRGLTIWSIANLDPPQACVYNQQEIYKMYVDKVWYDSSSIYKDNGEIYWPIEIEKERQFRYYKYATLDAQAHLFNTDVLASNSARENENKHLTLLEESQNKSTGDISADVGLHEPAFSIATSYLSYWLVENNAKTPKNNDKALLSENILEFDNLLIYPNPSLSGDLNILSSIDIEFICIYNMKGKIVLSNKIYNKKEFKLKLKLEQGTYLLFIYTYDGKFSSHKIILD
jgi:hypothetical protein